MNNLSIFLLATEKTGGLFDLDGTLPLIAVQFITLMFILNLILYTPLLDALAEREKYIRENIRVAGKNISDSNELISRYQKRLIKFNKIAEKHSIYWQEKFKIRVIKLGQEDQSSINTLLEEVVENLAFSRLVTLVGLEKEIDLLSHEIVAKILP